MQGLSHKDGNIGPAMRKSEVENRRYKNIAKQALKILVQERTPRIIL